MKNLPWHTKIVLALLAFLPLYFAVAALGTKIGIWSWQTGLMALTMGGGVVLLGVIGVAGVISMILAIIAKPRRRLVMGVAGAAMLGVVSVFAMFAGLQAKAGDNPIHDVATDTADPPAFSAETIAAREASEANPLSDYQTPLGQLELYKGVAPELAIKSHAQIITNRYASLAPLPLAGANRADAVAAVAAAMDSMGFKDIRTDAAAGTVEGVAESFWFGFKDDVIARIGENEIDFRSVSRVGRSDLGANAERIAELRSRVAVQIGQR
jgi:uncharacterized protein (DUF1499 family)